MSKSFAQQLVEHLEQQGVRRIYGLVGDSLNPITDAISKSSIEWVHVHHEEAAAFAAGAESLLTGELAVCAGSCGPGNTHLLQGLYDSHRNRAKVLALASHIPTPNIGSEYHQETHPTKVFEDASAYCEMVHSPEQGAQALHHAIQSTLLGKGVSVLVLPGDVSKLDAVDHSSLDGRYSKEHPTLMPPKLQVEALAEAINEAKTVAIFAGVGAVEAREELLELAEKLKAPIGHALRGKMGLQPNNPFDVGMTGLLGYGACHDAIHEAELAILIGTDFPYREFLPKNVAQIDVDGTRLGRRTSTSYPVHGDAKVTLQQLLPRVEAKDDAFLRKMLKVHEKKKEHVVNAYARSDHGQVPLHPEFVAAQLDEVAAADAVFTVDTGMCTVWGARYINNPGGRELLASFRHGTMANALPQAIGAQLSHPDRQVVAMCGDGGLAMLLGELLTVRLHELPLKMVVFNNQTLGMVKLEMMVEGMPSFGTDNGMVDYAAIAKGVGIHAIRVTQPEEVRTALASAMAHPGPVLVDVVTNPDSLSVPPDITMDVLTGFAKASARTALQGGFGELLDLAKSNIRNMPR
ncbi:pyruvate dehydrogenase [Corynebacterium gerontici]|uniref:Pyruvate dehydrogenase [ubiquinone] n=1 Tax=Corynebacterium gerontici TaxID=2079234 RepID=A0A3G6J7E6_9CORY|nr:pyruvate dehydrogenase [Corynebacterium gerontici]AZA12360.1 Pyruvate dehydrogenase [ubiquinone] [Corynebacterium gerontici]